MKTATQRNRILSHLRKASITPLQAFNRYGCLRLGARIYELKQQGYNIVASMVKAGDARVARYRLVR